MPAATRISARVLGPFLVIVDVTAVARASEMRALVAEFEQNSLWSWVAGSFVLLFGLVLIAAHPYWRGTTAITVSVLGWLIALRGLLWLAMPKTFASVANSMIGAPASWVSACIVFAVIGLYLTYVGWIPITNPSTAKAESSTPDLPRAA